MVSTCAAAAELGVGEGQVRDYIAARVLAADLSLGGAWDVEPTTLRALARGRGRGRRWSEETAWAALEILGGGATTPLGSSQRSRLRAGMRELTVARLAYLAEGRGTLYRLRQDNGTRRALLVRLEVSGASALAAGGLHDRFDLSPARATLTVGYLAAAVAAEVFDTFLLRETNDGDLLLRVANSPTVNDAVIALDLYGYGETRESAAGRTWLEGALRAL